MADWSPAIGKSWMDVDVRYVQLTGAGQARERITQHDDAERYYTYDYMDGPLVRDAMSSRFAVHSTADGGSEIVWSAVHCRRRGTRRRAGAGGERYVSGRFEQFPSSRGGELNVLTSPARPRARRASSRRSPL
ncbi:SRPBCC family protein [Rhodococcus opacus]|uniref:SRPBCC family protein n=1 Tax=Rhodococcus opacus TaxID=37919 RepID=UPI0034D2F9BB